MKTFCVYKIINTKNNKLYIGKTDDAEDRFKKHIQVAKNPEANPRCFSLIHKSIRKYGYDNFKVEVIVDGLTEEDALNQEIHYIAEYKTNVYKYGSEFGYNLTDGGDGISGKVYSDEEKEQLSKRMKGKFDGKKNPFYGKKHTEETKQKLSESRKKNIENKNPNYLGEKSSQSILTNEQVLNIVELYNGGMTEVDVSRKLNINRATVGSIITGKTWKHLTKDTINYRPPKDLINNRELAEQIIYDYVNSGLSLKALATKYNCTDTTILNIVPKNIRRRAVLTEELKIKVQQDKSTGLTNGELAAKYDLCYASVRKLLSNK